MPDIAALVSLLRLAGKDRTQLVLENIALRHQLAVYKRSVECFRRIRRECADHIIATGETHLLRTMRSYADYYNDWPNQSLDGNAPTLRAIECVGDVVATPVLGGLHHRYSRVA